MFFQQQPAFKIRQEKMPVLPPLKWRQYATDSGSNRSIGSIGSNGSIGNFLVFASIQVFIITTSKILWQNDSKCLYRVSGRCIDDIRLAFAKCQVRHTTLLWNANTETRDSQTLDLLL